MRPASGGFLQLGVELLKNGLNGPDDEREGHEHQREDDGGLRECDVDADRDVGP